MTGTVRVEVRDAIATMVLDRPARMNAMSAAMSRDVRSALAQVAASGARALVVRGEGSAFSAGADLHSLADDIDLDDAGAVRDYVLGWSHNVLALRALPMASVAAVEGPAYGGGFSFALACDIVVAADTARFNSQYVNIGINPDLGSSWTLQRAVGPALARYLMLRGNEISGAEASRIGLVAEVTETGKASARAYELAAELAARSPSSIAAIRRLLDSAHDNSLEAAMADEARAIAEAFATADFRAALAKFHAARAGTDAAS
jgi:2-(1,2-epoxy-1,2-dihydrophenyl)acetyl-CoA isomerase